MLDEPHRDERRSLVEAAFHDRSLLRSDAHRAAVIEVVRALDEGRLRVATRVGPGNWTTHAWIKQAVLLYFGVMEMTRINVGPFEYNDKIPLKQNLKEAGIRVVPPGTVRFGAFLEPGAVLMPGYVNIGAYVGANTMIDTWATVGSCAQIGRDCHLSGGVGIGGVLEPPSAQPVIIEDGCFIGSRAIIVEGVVVEEEAVIAPAVSLTASSAIIDVTGETPVEYRGRVPQRSVVIPGSRAKRYPAGEFQIACALIIGQRNATTDRKTSLNQALRDFNIAV